MPRVVVFDEFGGPDVLHVAGEPAAGPAAAEVRVRIEAFAVNPLDQMMRSGTSPAPVPLPHARLGVEGTGVVDALGPEVTGLETGDPVIITAIPDASVRGSYAEYTTVPASRVIARPAGLAITEAAAMQIARQIGAVPIAITRHTAKTGDLLAAGAAAVIATDHADVAEAVRHHAGGTGADIILDLVMGPGQQDLLKAARPEGTLVAAGFLDPRPTPFPAGTPLTIFSYRSFEHTLDAVVVNRMAAFLNAGVRLGALRPAIDKVFTLDNVADAHRHLEKGLHAGKKIVVTV
jgi:NADPH:quinone reductase-like Zn-dependent oxidoreductase